MLMSLATYTAQIATATSGVAMPYATRVRIHGVDSRNGNESALSGRRAP
jgi:hypothetical protein